VDGYNEEGIVVMKTRLLFLVLFGVCATSARAAGDGMYVHVGTTGFGVGWAGASSESISGRLGFDTWKRTMKQSDANGDYTLDLKLRNISALLDWYPLKGGFRTSVGIVSNGNKATLTATPSANGMYVFNSNQYNTSSVDSFTGQVKFNSVAPYLGLGWGNPVAKAKTWGFVTDVGVLFQGKPKVTSTVTCSAALLAAQGGAAACAQIQSDATAGAVQLETDLKKLKYWPVVSVGVSYHF
jgi:hypothetical protein